MATLKDLVEKRQVAFAQAKEFGTRAAAGTELSAEDNASWDRALEDVDALKVEIERRQRQEALDASFEAIDEKAQRDAKDAVDSLVGRSAGDVGADPYSPVFDKFLRSGPSGMSVDDVAMLQTRAQAIGSGGAGGYTVPEGFIRKVTETLKWYGGTLNIVEVINTSTGNDLPWPTNNDTGNAGAILAENTQITGQDITFGQKKLSAFMYTSKLILASIQFLQDNEVDAEGFIARKVGERLGRAYNTALTTGAGTTEPQGFVTGASTAVTTAGATAITYNELIDLVHSIDVAYRTGGARFVMNDLIVAYVRKIRDDVGGAGLGHPIWQPSAQLGQPDVLLGYPVSINNDMDSTVAATKNTIAFGNFQAGYIARQVANDMALMRLAERYADYLQVGFFGFGRLDGLVQDASAYKLLTQHA